MADCPGCVDGILSPLLHRHNSFTLRFKVEYFFSAVKSRLDISALFDQFVVRFGFFSLDREEFVQSGEYFIKSATPTSLIFGDYITPSLDFALYGEFPHNENDKYNPASPEPPRQPKRKLNGGGGGGESTTKKRSRLIKGTTPQDSLTSHHVVLGDGRAAPENGVW